MRVLLLVVVAACISACVRSTSPTSTLDAAAESYVRLVLALGERDSDSLDSYFGPSEWQAEAHRRFASLEDIRTAAASLIASLDAGHDAGGDERVRRLFLVRQLRAVVSRIEILRGARPAMADEARNLFGLDIRDVLTRRSGEDGRTAAYEQLERLLPGLGGLPARYSTFDRKFLIPDDRLEAVIARAIQGCRAATREHVTLPPGEHAEVEFVPDLPWSAFTQYDGRFMSRIRINTALPLTVDRALDLACHEAYPGHHTIDSLLEARVGGRRIEFTVRPLFSPQSLLHEAAASVAADLAFPGPARTTFEREELFPLAGLDADDADRYVRVSRLVDGLHDVQAAISRQYLDGELDFPRAAAAFERDALMPSADATLKFLNQFRSYAATYTIGRDAFAEYLDARAAGPDAGAGRWRAYIETVTDLSQTLPWEPNR